MNPPGAHATPLPRTGDAAEDYGEAGTRGQTVLAARVIEKIAGQVASDESSAGGSSGGFLGIGTRADLSARPKASVELAGNIATLRVEVGMLYPVPLRQATEELRRRIATRVTELTGVDVRQVDIRISWLTTGTNGRRRLL
ncbi:Asp23/Gls24 family envelope stress response protein [Arthrobacter sp. AL12]|uniref:Asp23/Gls24 family envelope stress response protein n=1 Tax=Arthrobacter sp. AL12 TaxID=3042241 RepID=UPI00249B78C6|nr:Asp23/Gls24 family envelope stress response protein [Arthrobacter sp. AL12]MDI3213985.1 Asp23/Gls24 family envelope stress response protein [Arthrobacter sp. AL12]